MRKTNSISKLKLDRETVRTLTDELAAVTGGMKNDRPMSQYPCPSILNVCHTGAIDCPERWSFLRC